ncbi:MAG: binding domain protein [Chthonomonadaceae bacterium]|nr:binding domain protein [Chthonomonadaceae bacterium]
MIPDMDNQQTIIIGAGIGGLTAAIALKQIGFQAIVFERAPEILELGAGISLWPNALKALDRLGLAERVKANGAPFGAGMLRTWKGDLVMESLFSPEQWVTRYGSAGACVLRAELHRLLVDALDADTIQPGTTCTGYRNAESGVIAQFEKEIDTQGDLLIGADGLRSVVRKQMLGESPVRYSGYTAWRGVAPYALSQTGASESWGQGARFGLLPLSQGRTYWFATRNAPEGQLYRPEDRKRAVMELFRGWHDPIQAVLDATPDTALLQNDIYDRPPVASWSRGCVTLLGDAAHPMTPNLGQGGCQAIEDAVILAGLLKNSPDIPSALQTYEARRIPRTSRLVDQSWRFGKMAQWENPLACGLRNWLFRFTSAKTMTKQLDPILRFEG